MMDVLDYDASLSNEWDTFVSGHPLASHGHLRAQFALAAASAISNQSLVLRDGGRVAGLLPLFHVRHRVLRGIPVSELASGAFFPAGPLVSTKLQGKAEARALELLLEGARDKAARLGADRLAITHPHVMGGQPSIVRLGYSPLLHHGYRPRHGVGLLLDLSQPIEKLAAARRSGCRQSITKAQAAAAVVPVRDRAEWLGCRELNQQTLGPLAFSDRQLESIWDDFIVPGLASAYAVHVNGRMAALTVTIHHTGSAYYWIGLNRRPAPLAGAGHLALWTAILDARDRGLRYFELGSLDFENTRNMGISQFKQSFGGVPYQIISAERDLRPVKSAAVALGAAVLAAAREWRSARRIPAAVPSHAGPPAQAPDHQPPAEPAVAMPAAAARS